MVPPNHPFVHRVFHHKPSILGYPYFWKHPNWPTVYCCSIFVRHSSLGNPNSRLGLPTCHLRSLGFPVGFGACVLLHREKPGECGEIPDRTFPENKTFIVYIWSKNLPVSRVFLKIIHWKLKSWVQEFEGRMHMARKQHFFSLIQKIQGLFAAHVGFV